MGMGSAHFSVTKACGPMLWGWGVHASVLQRHVVQCYGDGECTLQCYKGMWSNVMGMGSARFSVTKACGPMLWGWGVHASVLQRHVVQCYGDGECTLQCYKGMWSNVMGMGSARFSVTKACGPMLWGWEVHASVLQRHVVQCYGDEECTLQCYKGMWSNVMGMGSARFSVTKECGPTLLALRDGGVSNFLQKIIQNT